MQDGKHAGNVVLLRGATLWILMALLLAWCMVGLYHKTPYLDVIFAGKFMRLLQAHIDFLLMSALILGFYAAKVPLPWHVCWAMVVGGFTNSSLFLLQAIFPALDPTMAAQVPSIGIWSQVFEVYLFASLITTSYGFGKGAVVIFRSTLKSNTH
ncbi:hypothetical protein SAMN02949497_1222 [Methylomagnum ishizawai]|uniref:Uncharacterized protein n=1 Tax=Methylomagnum ishizawai TaxID=1760988 RepID=A0A1Y6CUF7_9GAMM|nr:hypothetical protein [Methylomagnum ishizawai]SMF93926.1 hypothetical protein SAMN02949497_1222 [Methylomagnum ishizawai]